MSRDPFGVAAWPWQRRGARVLPVVHGRLETARAVRAHLDALRPEAVVVEVPSALARPFLDAVARLPAISALRIGVPGSDPRWLLVEPTDGVVEAARWALEHDARVVCADLFDPDYPDHAEPLPDPAAIPEIGLAAWTRAILEARGPDEAGARDLRRETAIARAIDRERAAGRTTVAVVGLAHVPGVLEARAEAGVVPLPPARPPRDVAVLAVDTDCLVEILAEPPFVADAWERARDACESGGSRIPDPLGRPALFYELVRRAAERVEARGGSPPKLAERRVLHRFATRLALLRGRLCPDLYELVVAARGAVDDAFAKELVEVAGAWPHAAEDATAVRLSAADLGRDARLVRLRPRIDRLSGRRGLRQALARLGEMLEDRPSGICSHLPEDVVVEDLGARVRALGGRRAARGGARSVPFVASLLDGLDARETLRRWLVDGRPWVREERAVRAAVGAVVVIWDEDAGEPPRFPWCQVWHGEHVYESDMAFYATDPAAGVLAPGIHQAEYGGFLMIWPPWRLGDVWHDPAYAIARDRAERLIVAGLDYARAPLVALVAPRPPRAGLRALARRLGRRIVHVPLGTLPPDLLRRVRRFHVLADKRLRPIAAHLIDPP
ncbi:MAG: hypothetical protein D6738_02840 [Acidobacteria bacterium]|nr:MAG: hypothetical protein D6738_02840 [Acidobacteriota bacterium]